jgi:hypothetical protein
VSFVRRLRRCIAYDPCREVEEFLEDDGPVPRSEVIRIAYLMIECMKRGDREAGL